MLGIKELRKEIDVIDEKVVRLLARRVHISIMLGAEKRKLGRSVYDPEREEVVLEHVREHASLLGVSGTDVELIYRQIIAMNRKAQYDNP